MLCHSVHTPCGRLVKRMLYVFNFVTTISSVCSFAVGIWIAVTRKAFDCLVGTQLYVSVAVLLIVLGFFAAATCLTVNYAIFQELRCLLYTYSVSAMIIMLMMLITGVMGFEFLNQMGRSLEFEMISTLKNYYGVDDSITDAWDRLQAEFHCCGIETNTSLDLRLWRTSKWYVTKAAADNLIVPASCCVRPSQQLNSQSWNASFCQQTVNIQRPDPRLVFTDGCLTKLSDDLTYAAFVAGVAGITNSLMLVIPAAIAVWVAKLIQK